MITRAEELICKTQGKLFEYLANEGYDMFRFSNAYLHSHFCKQHFDTLYSRFQWEMEEEILDFLIPEIKNLLVKYEDNRYFDADTAYWIGYMYRQLYIETGISSKELSERVPFEAMCAVYSGMHTIDEEEAVARLCQDFSLKRKTARTDWEL